ncbi:MAG: hypothetical protein ACR2IB_05895 [Pyrinomonadaceae bacterium]
MVLLQVGGLGNTSQLQNRVAVATGSVTPESTNDRIWFSFDMNGIPQTRSLPLLGSVIEWKRHSNLKLYQYLETLIATLPPALGWGVRLYAIACSAAWETPGKPADSAG